MAVRALGAYDLPPADTKESFGGHLLVFAYFEGNPFFASVNTFRAPKETPWGVFRKEMLEPWTAVDPDADPSKFANWRVDDRPIEPSDDDTLEGLGIGFQSLLRFTG